ncbi:MAG: hypothetical protein H8E26_12375 [FCB group bacterium]|nr:hypothetical protein [FCB group bacterium]MBL7028296.1 hypothetical protein [Candidatus Neomarinimicrobiota bacterium]MBL7121615.1 hypothetical protein [Candidatus Neomarinimicrobiota bacterium]
MKIYILLFMLLISPSLQAEDIGSLFIGTSNVGGDEEFIPRAFDVEQGVSLGFLLPINIPGVDIHYKVRAGLHPVTSNKLNDDYSWDYISASNVLLAGKELPFKPFSLTILPQIGLGLIYENIYEEWGKGYVYNLMFVDYSLRITPAFLNQRAGLFFNMDKGFSTSMVGWMPMDRLNVSLLVSF